MPSTITQGIILHEIKYRPIGIIHSPFKEMDGMPIQPSGALGIKGTVELFTEYLPGLKDIEGYAPRNAVDLKKSLQLVFKDLPIQAPLEDDKDN